LTRRKAHQLLATDVFSSLTELAKETHIADPACRSSRIAADWRVVLNGWSVQFIEHSAVKKVCATAARQMRSLKKFCPCVQQIHAQAIGGLKLPLRWLIARVAAAIRLGLRKSRA
jgi:hypothetical protein